MAICGRPPLMKTENVDTNERKCNWPFRRGKYSFYPFLERTLSIDSRMLVSRCGHLFEPSPFALFRLFVFCSDMKILASVHRKWMAPHPNVPVLDATFRFPEWKKKNRLVQQRFISILNLYTRMKWIICRPVSQYFRQELRSRTSSPVLYERLYHQHFRPLCILCAYVESDRANSDNKENKINIQA